MLKSGVSFEAPLFCLPGEAGKPGLLKDASIAMTRAKTIRIEIVSDDVSAQPDGDGRPKQGEEFFIHQS